MVPRNGGRLTPCIFHHPYARCCDPSVIDPPNDSGLPLAPPAAHRFPRSPRVAQFAAAFTGRDLLTPYDVRKLEVGETARIMVMREQTLGAVVAPEQ